MTGIHIDHDSAVAPYEQVRLGIAALAAAGVYPAGHKLPPVRALATDLGLAANTVARAYRELEQAGLVETRGRAGTVITARAAHTPAEAQAAARTYVTKIHALGITDEQAVDLIRAALSDPR
ncbi:GntR family transcriptional regulator [Actinoplanes sp. NPDC049265]|uniref:GntR family transcriptional regulator n=1 Tax=Actinoplanes sp. NPDC049265 TaxID=3363902 RepID=UPI003724195B